MDRRQACDPSSTAAAIAERVATLGRRSRRRCPPGELLVVGVLRGAFIFMADLVRALPRPHACDFLAVRSYGDATETSGVVEITSDLSLPIEGKHVLLVEDIVDTGLTLKYLLELLAARRPQHLRSAPCCPSRRGGGSQVPVDFLGFEVPDVFVVGYGLDAAQRYRHLPYIAELRARDAAERRSREPARGLRAVRRLGQLVAEADVALQEVRSAACGRRPGSGARAPCWRKASRTSSMGRTSCAGSR